MELSSVNSLIRCLTPMAPSVSGIGCTGDRGSAPLVAGREKEEEEESRRRLILRFIILPPFSSGFESSPSGALFSKMEDLLFTVFSGWSFSLLLASLIPPGDVELSCTKGSGVFSLLSTVVGFCLCSESPMDSNLEVRSAESGRLGVQRGAGAGAVDLGSCWFVSSRQMEETGLGLELLGPPSLGLRTSFASLSPSASSPASGK